MGTNVMDLWKVYLRATVGSGTGNFIGPPQN